jgi:hypothetical protein
MDTGDGRFAPLQVPESADKLLAEQQLRIAQEALEAQFTGHGGWFQVGEIVVIKDSRFRVKSIKPTELRLKLLPKEG